MSKPVLLHCLSMRVDCIGSEVRQILQGVTEWVASLVDNRADPFDHLVSLEMSGELSSITAHVADTIFQMAAALDGLGADADADADMKKITYELDLGVSHCISHVSALASTHLSTGAVAL